MKTATLNNPGVQRAIKAAGSQKSMAMALGVTQQAVSAWREQGFVPASRAKEIEVLYGVPRAELISPKLRDAAGGAK